MSDSKGASAQLLEPASRPAYLWIVLCATLAYLVLELGFNARLLDVVGGGANLDQIHAIERWGRAISGFALALALWPIFLRRWAEAGRSLASRFFRTIGLLLGCIVVAYLVQEALVRKVVNTMDTAEKTQAQRLVVLQQGLVRGLVELPGLEFDAAEGMPPDIKAFVALMPLMGASINDLEKRFPEDLQRQLLTALAQDDAINAGEAWEKYREGIEEINEAFNEYASAGSRYSSGRTEDDAAARAEKKWEEYRTKVKRQFNVEPHELSDRQARQVRNRARRDLPGLPSNWEPWDEATFKRAVYDRALAGFRSAAREGLNRAPDFVPRELGWSHSRFMRHEPVQQRLRDELAKQGVTCLENYDAYQSSFQRFERNVVYGEMACRVDAGLAEMTGGTDPASVEAQERAAKVLWVPPIALFFSLLGAITHVFKTAFLMQRLALGREKLTGCKKLLIVGAGLALFFLIFSTTKITNVTTQALYESLENRITADSGFSGALKVRLLRATIQGQAIGYPLFEAIRVELLGGFTFGYEGIREQAAHLRETLNNAATLRDDAGALPG